jgi:malonate transporter
MADLLLQLSPLFALIALGAALKKYLLNDSVASALEPLLFYLLLPALTIHALADLPNINVDIVKMAAALLIAGGLLGVLIFAVLRAIDFPKQAMTSVLQGTARYNTFVAMAAGQLILGAEGLGLAALLVAVMTLPNNMTSVWLLTKYGQGGSTNATMIFKILKNPNIIACVLGLNIWLLNIELPVLIAAPMEMLAKATLPLSLLLIGAGIAWTMPKKLWAYSVITTFLKLLVVPLATLIVAKAFGLHGSYLLIAVLYAAVPAATSGYVMARKMGGDAELMASILGMQTAFCMITLPLWIYFVGGF